MYTHMYTCIHTRVHMRLDAAIHPEEPLNNSINSINIEDLEINNNDDDDYDKSSHFISNSLSVSSHISSRRN